MNKRAATIFVNEVAQQCYAAVWAGRLLNLAWHELASSHGRANPLAEPEDDPATRIYASAQSLLGAAGMVSKLLWGTKDRKKSLKRAAELRALLGVEDNDFAVLQNRAVRNSLEHFDERLDTALAVPHINLALRNIGPSNMGPDLVFLLHLDTATVTLSVLSNDGTGNDEVPLQELAEALEDVRDLARSWLAENRTS